MVFILYYCVFILMWNTFKWAVKPLFTPLHGWACAPVSDRVRANGFSLAPTVKISALIKRRRRGDCEPDTKPTATKPERRRILWDFPGRCWQQTQLSLLLLLLLILPPLLLPFHLPLIPLLHFFFFLSFYSSHLFFTLFFLCAPVWDMSYKKSRFRKKKKK